MSTKTDGSPRAVEEPALPKFGSFLLALYRGARELTMSDFQSWTFDLLRGMIHFDSALWMTGALNDSHDAATFHTRYLYHQPLQLLVDYNQCKETKVFSRKVLDSPGQTFACTPSVEMGPELAAHARRYSIEHILATSQTDKAVGLHELISLYRSDLAHPFSEEERHLQQCLAPHLSEGWRVCRMNHLTRLSQPACATSSYAAGADTQGILQLIDPGCTRLMKNEWTEWQGPKLPAQLLESHRRGDLRHVGRRVTFRLVSVDDYIFLRARPKALLDNLSRRERQVAEHYAAGRSHKEIAKELNVSPATVRTQLSAIYGKLHVDNKAALAALVRDYE